MWSKNSRGEVKSILKVGLVLLAGIVLLSLGGLSVSCSTDWQVKLEALSSKVSDSYNYIGARSGASDCKGNEDAPEAPPGVGDYISLYFHLPGTCSYTGKITQDIRSFFEGDETKVWNFKVSTNLGKDNDITLVWSQISQVPTGYSLILVDELTGDHVNMLDQTEYKYTTSEEKEIRNFTIIADSNPPSVKLETGLVSVGDKWKTVNLKSIYADPVVVAGPPTNKGSKPLVVRVNNVTHSSFDVKLERWEGTGLGSKETVGYLVVESGHHNLKDGKELEANTVELDKVGLGNFKPVEFIEKFNSSPVVKTSLVTQNETDIAIVTLQNINKNLFKATMQEKEANPSKHDKETMSYIAWEPSSGKLNGRKYHISQTAETVTEDWKMVKPNFGQKIKVRVQEETSQDNEKNHSAEQVGYLAFEGSTIFLAKMQTTEDSDPASLRYDLSPAPPENTSSVFRVNKEGDVLADGNFYGKTFISGSADIAEKVKVSQDVEKGDVLQLNVNNPNHYELSKRPYSTLAVGVVSTEPGITLREEGQKFAAKIALAGTVPVKVTTKNGPVKPGDLLTTSPKPGYAMVCKDKNKCSGAIVGKALGYLYKGKGKVRMIVVG